MLLLSLSALAFADPEPQVVTNALSNLCLGVQGVDGHTLGGRVEVYYCNPGGGDLGRDNQWVFVKGDVEGFVRLKNRVSGLCLGVVGIDQHRAGALVEVYTCLPQVPDRGLDLQWRVVAEADGFKRLENQSSGLCLGVQGGDSHQPGGLVEVSPCGPTTTDKSRDARWRLQGM